MEAVQDEDFLWRRAFTDSSGLFDNLSYGPLPSITDATSTVQPSHDLHVPVLVRETTNHVEPGVPTASPPVPDFASTPSVKQVLLPFPSVTSSSVALPSRQAIVPSPATPLASAPEWPSSNVGALGTIANVANSKSPTAAAAVALFGADDPEDFQGAPQQRGADSCARKRDRAKLLRQQMNDGLDSLHEALVEISTSGANPSASATTGLIPTRGPRRAAVVACSSGLVRDLIAACVALRAENAALTARLSATNVAQPVAAAAAPPIPPASAGVSNGVGVKTANGVDSQGVGVGMGANTQLLANANGAVIGERVERRGTGAAKVFGQLPGLEIFRFLGPQSLEEGRRVCRTWRDKCTWDYCWSTTCASRWKLCPEERHAEVWRATKRSAGTPVLSTPPSWRQVYRRLRRELRVPTGAMCSTHLIIGQAVKQGVAIWIALNRRSNGMTGRSVLGPTPGALRTAKVVELRAVVQRVDEGPSILLDPDGFRVRRVGNFNVCTPSLDRTGSQGSAVVGSVFPSLSKSEERFAPRVMVNTGKPSRSVDHVNAGTMLHPCMSSMRMHMKGYAHRQSQNLYPTDFRAGGWRSTSAGPPLQRLALFDYAAVDFFIETPCCPTERDFLQLATSVDVQVSTAQGGAGHGGMGTALAGRYQEEVIAVVLNKRGSSVTGFGEVDACPKVMMRSAKRRALMT